MTQFPDAWRRGLPDAELMVRWYQTLEREATVGDVKLAHYRTLATLAAELIRQRLPNDVGYIQHNRVNGAGPSPVFGVKGLTVLRDSLLTDMLDGTTLFSALQAARGNVLYGVCPIDDEVFFASARVIERDLQPPSFPFALPTKGFVGNWYRDRRRENLPHTSMLRVCGQHLKGWRCGKCAAEWNPLLVGPDQLARWGWTRCERCSRVATLASLKPTKFQPQTLRQMLKHHHKEGFSWETDSN